LHPVLTRKDYMGAHEWCFYGWREGAAHQFFGPANATDLWAIKKVTPQKMIHLCLHPDALVLTEAGFRAIRSVAVGDRVLSADGTFHGVAHVSVHPYASEHLYRIVAKGGNAAVEASDNHPFLIWRPAKRARRIIGGDVGWVRADAVRIGDYTLTPVLAESAADPFPELDEEDWFLFGLYLAQGHLQRAGHGDRRYAAFSLHKRRQDLAERIWNKWPQAREYDHNDYRPGPTSGTVVMAFDGDAGARFEALGGRRAQGKRLAPACFALPHSKRAAILHGWLNGDGCVVHDRAYWQGNTVSADLAAHPCLLAESVGYRTNVYSYNWGQRDQPHAARAVGGLPDERLQLQPARGTRGHWRTTVQEPAARLLPVFLPAWSAHQAWLPVAAEARRARVLLAAGQIGRAGEVQRQCVELKHRGASILPDRRWAVAQHRETRRAGRPRHPVFLAGR
jgi:hypothetical protein